MTRGYFEVAVYNPKTPVNIGTLCRSAFQLGATSVHIIGQRWKNWRQSSDTVKSYRHLAARSWESFDDFHKAMPYGTPLIGIEMGGKPLASFKHPERAIYLLGAEDHGLPEAILKRCHQLVSLESVRTESYNLAVAGSIVIYDRVFGGNHVVA